MSEESKIEVGNAKFWFKSRSLTLMVIYAILFFSVFGQFPSYAHDIYGNQSLPGYVQTIFVLSPILIFLALGVLLLVVLAWDFILYRNEKKLELEKMRKELSKNKSED